MMVRKFWRSILIIAMLTAAGGAFAGTQAQAQAGSPSEYRQITDMAGRRVLIPVKVSKVLSTSPPPAMSVYMISPEKLGGWLFSPTPEAQKYLPEPLRDIPVLGWGRKVSNYEAYIAQHPDLVFAGYEAGMDPGRIDLIQEKFGSIPVVCVDNTRDAVGYAEPLRFMGEVLGAQDRVRPLIEYYEGILKEVRDKISAIPEEKRVRVYYAEKENGLATDPAGSFHSQLIEVCGGVNVAECKISDKYGMTAVTAESVLMWNPDVVITTSPEFIRHAQADGTWKKTTAVRNQRIYCAPRMPFNWFDRPPGVNRIVGIPWTARVLYPELFSQDWLKTRVKTFFSLFYHYRLSEGELLSLVNG